MPVSHITVGSFGFESVVTAGGEVFRRRIGGNTVYAAVGAHCWSNSVGVIGSVPANFPAEWLRAFADAGVDIRGAVRVDSPVDQEEWFIYRPDGSRLDHLYADENAVRSVLANPAALQPAEAEALLKVLTPHPSQDSASLEDFRLRHPPRPIQIPEDFWPLHGCHLAPLAYERHLELARLMHSRGVLVTLDPGRYVREMARGQLEPLLAQVDAFLPSLKELEALFPGAGPADGLRALAGPGRMHAAVKLGGDGCLVWHAAAKTITHVPACPARILHLNGAGDAFCGGFLTGLVETGDPVLAARRGVISASIIIEAQDALAVLGAGQAVAQEKLQDCASGPIVLPRR